MGWCGQEGRGPLLHAVTQRLRVRSSSGSAPPGTSGASGSSCQIKEKRAWKITWEIVGARPENGLYHFCSHSLGQSSSICPHQSAGEAGKCSLAVPKRKRRWFCEHMPLSFPQSPITSMLPHPLDTFCPHLTLLAAFQIS